MIEIIGWLAVIYVVYKIACWIDDRYRVWAMYAGMAYSDWKRKDD